MKKQVLTVVLSVFILNTWAYKLDNNGGGGSPAGMVTRAGGCAPGQARQVMEFNNVKALLEEGGLLFLDRSLGKPSYEVPKGGGVKAIYGNSLWMGGKDFNDQLKIGAIIAFRTNGNDFWAGPLVPGVATIEESVCAEYDKFYYANRAEVLAFYNDYIVDNAVSTVPSNISNWPAFGPSGQPLAPFYDADGSGDYDPNLGDMPWFQFKKTATELSCGNDRTVTMYGDQAYWWVFNDKGNVHTESSGDPIGMEIHAQAFAFNTDDEVNDMTFYNYELINRSTQTLYNTYFGNFFDCDLGYYLDDYVGCDVSRGLGYYFNGDPDDATTSGSIGYGLNPPSIGVDYFQGPYQDEDSIDNPLVTNYAAAVANKGIPYTGIGIGYGDTIKDNERFGMRKFMSYTGLGAPNANMSDPGNAPQAYNYLVGTWRDGSQLSYGGNGYPGLAGVTTQPTDYIFFYDSDPYYWATRGVPVTPDWREDLAGNLAGDRRMIESSGPFTLKPGAYNNITIGIVYARAYGGIPFSSAQLLFRADDKAQALFDNCFKILEGPNAPDVTTQELNKEVILMLSNNVNSNNYKEKYIEADPFIILPDEAPFNDTTQHLTQLEIDSIYRSYKFQGYLIYQLANDDIKSGDLLDPDKARLVEQVDIKDGVTKLLNWARDPSTNFVVPTLKVDGADKGITHSFKITTDAFTQATLINHKTYYYMALSYASNNYKTYDPAVAADGQLKTFVQSRKTSGGEEVPVIKVIPHIPVVENGGTSANSAYGDGPIITRIEGRGCGSLDLKITQDSENEILANNFAPHPQYYGGEGNGPIEVKIIDPLNVTDHNFRVVFNDSASALDAATWTLMDLTTGENFDSDWGVNIYNEQIFPQYGFSITINQWLKKETIVDGPVTTNYLRSDLIRSSIAYSDLSAVWLDPVKDEEGNTELNWIRSGSVKNTGDVALCEEIIYNDKAGYDNDQIFEKIIEGTISPYHLVARSYAGNLGTATTADDYSCPFNAPVDNDFNISQNGGTGGILNFGIKTLRNLEIVITPDKDKWTRCPVVETTDDAVWATSIAPFSQKQCVKLLPSLDKNGNPGDGVVTADPNDADFINARGMSWFPGYVIDVETGTRLNVAFGEDSRYVSDNGKDMKWNPTSTFYGSQGEPIWGGKHYLYIFNNTVQDIGYSAGIRKVPNYDFGALLRTNLEATSTSVSSINNTWGSCSYVWVPKLTSGYTINNPATDIPCEARMSIRVKRPYEKWNTSGSTFDVTDLTGAVNDWDNVYDFSMSDLASQIHDTQLNDSILSLINVVPNPYYAYSAYESSRLVNQIKIVNLPDECTIRIYNVSGALIRTITKSTNSVTSVDWDLKNQKGIPIAGGVYLMHVDVPGVGERVLKWFGALRPTDLVNF